jgi:hypothetical protein
LIAIFSVISFVGFLILGNIYRSHHERCYKDG